jgi:membrane fusion protein (multidrug efflux system)
MKRTSIVFLIIVALLLAAIVVLGIRMGSALREQDESAIEESVIPVKVYEVKTGEIEDIIDLTGWIEAEKQVNLIAKLAMPGRLIRNTVKEGDWVRKDQVVSWVDRDEVGAQFTAYPVKSPIRGIVSKLTMERGDLVTAQMPVGVVIDIRDVIVKTSVIEKDYGRIKTGLKARVRTQAYPERVFEGKVSEIAPALDEFSHTANIEIKIPNPDYLLRPGMYAKIELVVDTRQDTPIIPRQSVFKEEADSVVFKVSSDTVKLQKVDLGYYDLKRYEVLKGLEPGDLVVATDQAILQDGTKVKVAERIEY